MLPHYKNIKMDLPIYSPKMSLTSPSNPSKLDPKPQPKVEVPIVILIPLKIKT